MGRQKITQPPLPVSFVLEAFDIRDGVLIWRERPRDHFPCRPDDAARFNNQRAGEPAGFAGPDGKPMVRLQFEGKTRRVALLRVAWIVATGELPHGVVRPRDGDEWNASEANLIVTRAGPHPFDYGRGGKALSLERRAKATTTLITALADHPGATVPQLSRLVGSSAPCVCTRLGELSDMGLTCGPKCDARARWDLSERGRELAATGRQPLDDRDRRVLAALSVTPMGVMKLARRVEVCPMTIKRRARLLVQRGLIHPDPRRFFSLTDEGRQAIGANTAPPCEPWINPATISAAQAKDVLQRLTHPNDNRSGAQRSAHATMAAAKAVATQRLRKMERRRFAFGDLDMAG
jgi:hypothetical protein